MPDAGDPTQKQDEPIAAPAAPADDAVRASDPSPSGSAAEPPRTPAPAVREEGDALQAAAQQGGSGPESGDATPAAEAVSSEAPELAALRRELMEWARGRFAAVAVAGVLLGVVIGSVVTVFLVETRVRSGIRGEVERLDASLQSIESSAAATRTALARTSADAGAARVALETLDGRAGDLLQRYELLSGRLVGFEQSARARSEVSENAILDRIDAIESLVATSPAFTPGQLEDLAETREEIEADAEFLIETLEDNAAYEVLILYDATHDAQSAEIAADLRELGFRVAEAARTRENLGIDGTYDRAPLLGDIASLNADEKAGTLARIARGTGIQTNPTELVRRAAEADADVTLDRRELVLFLVE